MQNPPLSLQDGVLSHGSASGQNKVADEWRGEAPAMARGGPALTEPRDGRGSPYTAQAGCWGAGLDVLRANQQPADSVTTSIGCGLS